MTTDDGRPRLAVVTGANRGIGFEISRQLALKGVHVVLTSRDPVLGQEARARIMEELGGGSSVTYRQLDVACPESRAAFVEAVLRDFGRVDILVNNAGVCEPGWSEDVLVHTLSCHLIGPIDLTEALLPAMLANGFGRVVQVSSGDGELLFFSSHLQKVLQDLFAPTAVPDRASFHRRRSELLDVVTSVFPSPSLSDGAASESESESGRRPAGTPMSRRSSARLLALARQLQMTSSPESSPELSTASASRVGAANEPSSPSWRDSLRSVFSDTACGKTARHDSSRDNAPGGGESRDPVSRPSGADSHSDVADQSRDGGVAPRCTADDVCSANGTPAYTLSKALLNAYSSLLGSHLIGSGVLVNCMCPGDVRTRMGPPSADRTAAEAADTAIWLATLPPGASETAMFWRDRDKIPW